MERKLAPLEAVEFKLDEARKGFFAGYASVFGGVDSYGDTILPGAYKKTLKHRRRPVQMRWNHYGPVIGKWLRLEEDEKGLYVEGELTPGHSVAEDAYALLKHGAVDGLSIGYRPVKVENHGDGRRTLKEIELIEISIVESPADLSARVVDVKSALDEAESLKDIEALLREAAGFSRAGACALVSRTKAMARGGRDDELKTSELLEAIKAIKAITAKLTAR